MAFPVSADRAFAYLVEPDNRPQWQSSLRSVADVRGDGSAWTDVTVVPGGRPGLRTTIAEPPYRGVEAGVLGPFRARLELRFTPTGDETCAVSADFAVHGLGVGRLLSAGARPAVAADLRRAAALLSR